MPRGRSGRRHSPGFSPAGAGPGHADDRRSSRRRARQRRVEDRPGTRSVIATATAAGSFNTFVAAIKTAGLTETLEGNGPFTVFAPTDAAFAKLPKDKLDALLKDQAKLKAILSYHVLPGNYTPAQLAKLTSAKTLNGKTLKIAAKDGKVWADNGAGDPDRHARDERWSVRDRHRLDAELVPVRVELGGSPGRGAPRSHGGAPRRDASSRLQNLRTPPPRRSAAAPIPALSASSAAGTRCVGYQGARSSAHDSPAAFRPSGDSAASRRRRSRASM